VMVEVVNSTAEPDGSFKDYWLRVQPDCRPLVADPSTPSGFRLGSAQKQTALNAVASTYGMTGEEYRERLAVET
jgi:hypothetical protein